MRTALRTPSRDDTKVIQLQKQRIIHTKKKAVVYQSMNLESDTSRSVVRGEGKGARCPKRHPQGCATRGLYFYVMLMENGEAPIKYLASSACLSHYAFGYKFYIFNKNV